MPKDPFHGGASTHITPLQEELRLDLEVQAQLCRMQGNREGDMERFILSLLCKYLAWVV